VHGHAGTSELSVKFPMSLRYWSVHRGAMWCHAYEKSTINRLLRQPTVAAVLAYSTSQYSYIYVQLLVVVRAVSHCQPVQRNNFHSIRFWPSA